MEACPIMDNGLMIYSMAWAHSSLKMDQCTKDHFNMARNQGMEFICGQINQYTKGTLTKITWKEKVYSIGLMVASIKDTGKKISFMEMDSINGQMAECIKAHGRSTKDMAMESRDGQMEDSMMANGKITNNMGKVSLNFEIIYKNKEFGKMANYYNGSANQ